MRALPLPTERGTSCKSPRNRTGTPALIRPSLTRGLPSPTSCEKERAQSFQRTEERCVSPVTPQAGRGARAFERFIRCRFKRLGCHPRRAQRARSGIQSKTSVLGSALDSRSGLRPAGNDKVRPNGSGGIRITCFATSPWSAARETAEIGFSRKARSTLLRSIASSAFGRVGANAGRISV